MFRARPAVVVLAAAIGCAAGCASHQRVEDEPASDVPALHGTFANDGCLSEPNEDGTTTFFTVAFDLTPTTWAADVVMYGDDACTTKQGTIHMDGPFELKGASATVPGAFEADLGFTRRTVTPHVDGFIALLQSISCGKAPYALNEPQDILESGCKDLGALPLATCPKELDLVKIEGDGSLRFGSRPDDHDVCSPDKRPRELGSVAFKPLQPPPSG